MRRLPVSCERCLLGADGGRNDDVSTYYKPEHLPKFAATSARGTPELAEKFFDYYGAVFADGALSAREKALIALGRRPRGAVPLLHRRLQPGVPQEGRRPRADDRGVHVACAIRGGASLVHGVQMLEHVRQGGDVDRMPDALAFPSERVRSPACRRAAPAHAPLRSRRRAAQLGLASPEAQLSVLDGSTSRLPARGDFSGARHGRRAPARGPRRSRSSRSTSASSAT